MGQRRSQHDDHNPNNNQLPSLKTLAADSDTSAIGFGIYAADQIKLDQYFDIVGGVRWDYFDADVKDHFLDDKRKQIDKMWSYRGGLVFHPTPSQSYYFSYGTSFNPSAEGIALSPATNGTPPEKNEIFEVGAKLEFFGGALGLQTAVFRIEKTNARTPNPNDPTLPNVVTGKQRSQGFELGLTGRLFPGLNIFSGYTFLDTEILKDNTCPIHHWKRTRQRAANTARPFGSPTTFSKNGRSAAARAMSAADSRTTQMPTEFPDSSDGIQRSHTRSPRTFSCGSTRSI